MSRKGISCVDSAGAGVIWVLYLVSLGSLHVRTTMPPGSGLNAHIERDPKRFDLLCRLGQKAQQILPAHGRQTVKRPRAGKGLWAALTAKDSDCFACRPRLTFAERRFELSGQEKRVVIVTKYVGEWSKSENGERPESSSGDLKGDCYLLVTFLVVACESQANVPVKFLVWFYCGGRCLGRWGAASTDLAKISRRFSCTERVHCRSGGTLVKW